MGDLADLVASFDVEPVGPGRFRAKTLDAAGRDVVEGAQILAQSIVAACKSQPDKTAKSAHMIFARAATVQSDLELELDTTHAGRSFGSATVTARQGEKLCARGLVLLERDTPDLIRHGARMPLVPGPDASPPFELGVSGRELRIVGGAYTPDPEAVGPPELHVWLRYREAPPEPYLRQALVADFTGRFSIATAMRPHQGIGEGMAHRSLSTGVLAITVSYHDPVPVDGWLLYAHESTHAGRGRAYSRAQVFSEDGRLVASFTQESMIRPLAEAAKGMGTASAL